MKPRIDMIGIVTNQFGVMRDFYRDVLGFEILMQVEWEFVEFVHDGVRFALTTRQVMRDCTRDESFLDDTRGHTLELAFRSSSPQEVDIDFADVIARGAKSVQEPADMPWWQRTAFFSDPDGHVHEIFADM